MLKRWLDFLVGLPLVWMLSFLADRRSSQQELRKILVIKLAAIGDTVLLIPVLHSFREAHPEATIHWLISNVNAPIARNVPYVDEPILWEGVSPFRFIALVMKLHREQYDVVVDFEQWARGTAILSFFAGVSTRVGFNTPGQYRHRLYTDTVQKNFRVHELDDFYALAARLGPLNKQPGLEILETDNGRNEIAAVLRVQAGQPQLRVLIHPGCGADGLPREWPLARYAELAEWLLTTHNAQILISGGPEEKHKTAELTRRLKGEAIDVGGKLSWNGVISLVNLVDLVISGNTGVMHIAAALRKKQVALHGPTDPLLWGPVNPNAIVIQSSCPVCPSLRLGFEYHRKNQSCMALIGAEEVKAAVTRILE